MKERRPAGQAASVDAQASIRVLLGLPPSSGIAAGPTGNKTAGGFVAVIMRVVRQAQHLPDATFRTNLPNGKDIRSSMSPILQSSPALNNVAGHRRRTGIAAGT